MERILGAFEARKPSTWTADVLYSVAVADGRLVATVVGGQFTGAHGQWTAHFGPVGGLIGGWLQKKHEKARAERDAALAGADLDATLHPNKKNFEMRYDALTGARIRKRSIWAQMIWPGAAELVLEPVGGKPMKLLLQEPSQLQRCVELLQKALREGLQVDAGLSLQRWAA